MNNICFFDYILSIIKNNYFNYNFIYITTFSYKIYIYLLHYLKNKNFIKFYPYKFISNN